MKLVLLHGPVASGKLTVARALAARTGFALFHNHLVVDTVGALFPFGSEHFRRLREEMWIKLLGEAAHAGRDTIFTFAPEPTVHPAFIPHLITQIEKLDGTVVSVRLTVEPLEQERRIAAPDRAAFGKLRDLELLRSLRHDMMACENAMPPAALTIDTGRISAESAAGHIVAVLSDA